MSIKVLSKKTKYQFRVITPGYPAFNIYSTVAKRTTALGPVLVATIVNQMQNWKAEVIDENNLYFYAPVLENGRLDHEFVQKERPADVLGLYGGLTSTIPRLYEIAKYYKKIDKNIIIVAGGQHFAKNNINEAFSAGVDYVILGEADETIKELFPALEQGLDVSKIKGLAYLDSNKNVKINEPRDPITDFDDLPLADFSLVRHANITLYPVSRIRGCGMDCEFCTVKGRPRYGSVERLMAQITYLVETRNAKYFFVVDDLFGQQRKETIRFCELLKDYQKRIHKRLDFTVQIRLDKAKDPELLMAMRSAGIDAVAIGFESPIDEELKVMKKNIRQQDMISLVKVFHKFGFIVHGMFIFGYPLKDGIKFDMDIDQRIKHFKNFMRTAKIDTVQVLLPVPLPGTELEERLKSQNRIYSRDLLGWEYYDGNFPLFEPDPPVTAEDMHMAIRKIMGRFYQFKYMLLIGLHIFSFPAMVFFLHNIKWIWSKWYRIWRNNVIRFGGWIVLKGWTAEFKKSSFSAKLSQAKQKLN